MSRSLHTRPRWVIAHARLEDPYQPRRAGDTRRQRRQRRQLKRAGLTLSESKESSGPSPKTLRIKEQRPRPGYAHPANSASIREFLKRGHEEWVYGLQSIELRQGAGSSSLFGEYRSPGLILLYDQALGPWSFRGRLKSADCQAFEEAGAVIEKSPFETLVSWPRQALKQFMLNEVLLHEIGHHILQHHKGKRKVRIARARDHERFAHQYAVQKREGRH